MNDQLRIRARQFAPHALTILIVAVMLVATRAWAAPTVNTTPGVITYQGYLTETSGASVNGNVDITFRLFNVPTGGSALWTEAHSSITVTDGWFNVFLGSIQAIPASVWTNSSVYLELQVGTDSAMTPRELVSSVPYALYAMHSDRAYGLSAADGDPDAAVYVDNSGNVGIGANSPAANLHVQTQNAAAKARIEVQGDENAQLELASNGKMWQWSKRASGQGDELWLSYHDGIVSHDYMKVLTNGDIDLTANSLQIDGYKPVFFRHYEGLTGGSLIRGTIQKANDDKVYYSDYACAMVGFRVDGDIQEIDPQSPLLMATVSYSYSGEWEYFLQLADKDTDVQAWQVDVMCVDRKMAVMVDYPTPP